jgi:DNA polymerase
MKNKIELYEKLALQIKSCQKCRLCETATQSVVGDGSLDAKIIFIGEAPGKNEDASGIPFVGRAGKLLTSLIEELGLKREDVWIGNIIKHRPPKNRDPLKDEIEACRDFLTQQISIIKPEIIVTLGRFSFNYFVPDGKIGIERGKLIDMGSYRVFPVYHPAAALRNKNFLNTLRSDFTALSEIMKLKNIES